MYLLNTVTCQMAYVKAEKESHLEILLQVPQAMEVNEATDAKNNKELLFELRKSLYGLQQAGRL